MARLNPSTATAVMVGLAAIASAYCLVATRGSDISSLPLVAAPLLALYWVARLMGNDAAAGWAVFGAGFIIVMPMVMFLLVLSVSSRGGIDPDLGINFGVLVMAGPIVQLIATALLYLFARMLRSDARSA